MSYNGKMNFGLLGDFDAMPDLRVVADGITESIEELRAAAGIRKRRPARRPAAATAIARRRPLRAQRLRQLALSRRSRPCPRGQGRRLKSCTRVQ